MDCHSCCFIQRIYNDFIFETFVTKLGGFYMFIKILKEKEMTQLFSMREAIDADKKALELYSNGKATIPLRTNIDVEEYEGQNLYMSGLAGDAAGVKIVSVYPNNIAKGLTSVPASMILLNEETGEISSIMDGTFLTQLRTGAISGAATELLSREDSRVFALFGTGGQAESQLEAVLTVRNIQEVYVMDLDYDRATDFAEKMTEKFGEEFGVRIQAVKDAKEAVENADVITTVTTAPRPVFDMDHVKSGAHINGVGSYTPKMQEIPGELFAKAGKIFLDTRDGVLNESGDLINPMEDVLITEKDISGELGELISGSISGRENNEEITIFKTTGSAVLDLVVAKEIYKKAVEQDVGMDIEI